MVISPVIAASIILGGAILAGARLIMSGLSDLQTAVAANTDATNKAVAAVQTLSSAGDSDSQVGALAATLSANNAALNAAVDAALPPAPLNP